MHLRSYAAWTLCLALAIQLLASPSSFAGVRVVALSERIAAGVEVGQTFQGFSPPTMNDLGQVAFYGSLAGAGVDDANDSGVWSEGGDGVLSIVTREGDFAPGMGDARFADFGFGAFDPSESAPVINARGVLAFKALAFSNGSSIPDRTGIWTNTTGALRDVAVDGTQAFGAPDGQRFLSLGNPALNDHNQIAFRSDLTGTAPFGLPSAVHVETNEQLRLVARADGPVPGVDVAGVTFDTVYNPTINNLGETAFRARLQGPGIVFGNSRGIWAEPNGALELIAREGEFAPGGHNLRIHAVTDPVMNTDGQVVFRATQTTGTQSTWAVWASNDQGDLDLIARVGADAPDTGGLNYASIDPPIANAAGHVGFTARIAAPEVPTNRGVWTNASGDLTLLARTGDQAPDADEGVLFSSLSLLGMNAAGQSLITAQLRGDGVDATNDFGIWGQDRDGIMQLIAREGDSLTVGPNDSRIIETLAVFVRSGAGNDEGRPSAFNNPGELAFHATFTDGSSGVFVSNRIAVPEPSTQLLLACMTAGWSLTRGRSRERR